MVPVDYIYQRNIMGQIMKQIENSMAKQFQGLTEYQVSLKY